MSSNFRGKNRKEQQRFLHQDLAKYAAFVYSHEQEVRGQDPENYERMRTADTWWGLGLFMGHFGLDLEDVEGHIDILRANDEDDLANTVAYRISLGPNLDLLKGIRDGAKE